MRFALPEWATKPEFGTILAILALLLTIIFGIWGPDVRRIIHTRPTATRNWWRSSRLDSFKVELYILKRCHNNVYELVLYVLTQLSRMALLAVGYVIVLIPIRDPRVDLIVWASSVVTMALAFMLGQLYFQLRHLRRYDERVAYLEKKIAEYT